MGPASGGACLCPPPGSRAQVAAVVASGPWAAAPAHMLNLTGSLPSPTPGSAGDTPPTTHGSGKGGTMDPGLTR